MAREYLDYGGITSVVVSRGGEIVREEYVTGAADTLRDTRSCTKTVLAMLLGIAIEQRLVTGGRHPGAGPVGRPHASWHRQGAPDRSRTA